MRFKWKKVLQLLYYNGYLGLRNSITTSRSTVRAICIGYPPIFAVARQPQNIRRWVYLILIQNHLEGPGRFVDELFMLSFFAIGSSKGCNSYRTVDAILDFIQSHLTFSSPIFVLSSPTPVHSVYVYFELIYNINLGPICPIPVRYMFSILLQLNPVHNQRTHSVPEFPMNFQSD